MSEKRIFCNLTVSFHLVAQFLPQASVEGRMQSVRFVIQSKKKAKKETYIPLRE